jgi:hypothetical protein
MPKAMQALFSAIVKSKASKFKDVVLKINYLEIYNETIQVIKLISLLEGFTDN